MSKTKNGVQVRKRTYSSGKTVWEYRFEGIADKGQTRKQISKSGFETQLDALQAGTKAYETYYKFGHDDKQICLADFILSIWLPHTKSVSNWRDTTTEGYAKKIKNYILHYIGNMNIDEILPIHIENLLNGLYRPADGLSHNTISDLHALLNSIFSFAQANRYIEHSPMAAVRVPKRKPKDKETRRKERDVIPTEILDAIFVRFGEDTAIHLPVKIALLAGLRLGEVFGLAWEDLDFENNIIHIKRQYQVSRNGDYVCNPKYDSKRDVPMCDELRKLLLKTKEKQDFDRKNNKDYLPVCLEQKYDESGTVLHDDEFYVVYGEGKNPIHFVNVRTGGKLITPTNTMDPARIIHGYDTNYKRNKIKHKNDSEHPYVYEKFDFHSLRHTFASRLREKGVPEIVIGKLLGHSGKGQVTYTYLHTTPEEFDGVKEIMDRLN